MQFLVRSKTSCVFTNIMFIEPLLNQFSGKGIPNVLCQDRSAVTPLLHLQLPYVDIATEEMKQPKVS